MPELEEKFVEKLLQCGGFKAVEYYIKRWAYPSDSNIEEAYNKTVKEIVTEILQEFREGMMDALTAVSLLHKYRPVTQKTRYFQDYYIEASEIWNRTLEEILNTMDWDTVSLFNEEFRRKWKWIRAPETATITINKVPDIRLYRRNKSDVWYLSYEGEHNDDLYVRLGHIGASKITTSLRTDEVNGNKRISILVNHEVYIHDYCNLPAATEINVTPSGVTFSPWRLKADVFEALYPAKGSLVRQGDAILRAKSSFEDAKLYAEESTLSTMPKPKEELEWENNTLKVPNDVQEVTFTHPDHLPVTVTKPTSSEGEWYIVVHEAEGHTFTPQGVEE